METACLNEILIIFTSSVYALILLIWSFPDPTQFFNKQLNLPLSSSAFSTISYKITCLSSKRMSRSNKTEVMEISSGVLYKRITFFIRSNILWFSFNHIISLIHPPIIKLKVLAHKFSISWEMCALDWLSSPNLHHYRLWPSLEAAEYD